MLHPMRRAPIQELRLAIDCLPRRTRVAMLEGIRHNQIIAGAYTDRAGGVCPMLAAHRCGGRTSFLSFARAWDRFTKAKRPRRATAKELRVLESHLEASLLAEDAADLRGAIAEHQAVSRARREREARATGGWGWLRSLDGRREDAGAHAERARELV